MNESKILKLKIIDISDCYCNQDVVKKLNLPLKGDSNKLVQSYIKYHNIDTSHFDKNKKLRKYPIITKSCPICNREFSTQQGAKKEKITCSYSCSNTYFRSGNNNGTYKDDSEVSYRRLCFRYHTKECIICKEDKIVAVHHFDENHNNNDLANLIPLCPTHHQYIHSQYKYLIEDEVNKYRENFISNLKI